MDKRLKRVIVACILLISIILIGITGYMLIEDLSLFEAWYMTINAISTSGFGEIKQLSYYGKFFTTILILLSFGVVGYVITSVAQYAIEGNFQKYFKNLRVNQKIQKLKDHVIICGYGRNGRQVAKELSQNGIDFVLIESSEEQIEKLVAESDFLFIHGDAIKDNVLISAGIKHAKALITVLPSDADNLFVVLTSREMNPTMTIISRASYTQSEHKLKLAGATNVIMPGKIGGSRMAKLVIQPDVVEFLESVLIQQNTEDVKLFEIACSSLKNCTADKRSIRQLRIRSHSGANIIGIKTEEGNYHYNPSPDTTLSCTDKLFALGTSKQIDELQRLLNQFS
jgi:voltage-gated potassium channel